LRLLEYIGRVYEKTVNFERRFQRKLEKIPRPEFIVLYNGNEPFADRKELRLSDAFMDVRGLKQPESGELPLELVAQVYNINQGHNAEILKKSATLDSYSVLISKIWEYRNSKLTLEESLKLAIKYCINNGILKDFLRQHSSEVFSMLYGEYRLEDEIAVVKREVWEDAWEESRKQEKLATARNLLAKGSSFDFIQEITGLDLDCIQGLKN